jgi:3-isopropylmalate/(R)-2-methylmalate dehydratase large subunit
MGQTIAQKIFDDPSAHRVGTPDANVHVLRLDAVFCHEITTPPAIVDLVAARQGPGVRPGRIKVVIDHVTPAKDSKTALQGKILRDWARRHGIADFFDIGAQRGLPRPVS